MADERLYSIRLGLDATQGTRNIREFHKEFNRTLEDMGQSKEEIGQFKQLARDAANSESALQDVDEEMRGLVRSYNQLKREASARDKLNFVPDKEIERQVRAVRGHFATLQRSGKLSAQELARAYDETERQIRQLRGETARAAAQSENALARIAKRAVGVIAAFAGFRQLSNLVGGVFRTGDQFERLDKQLEALTGSAESAQDAMEWIQDFTTNTPLQLEQVTEQFTRLKAFGLDPMDGTLQALVDQNEKLGGGYERLNGIVNAFGQAWAKQKLQGEEILQLIERGVPVWDTLTKVTGESTAELQRMATAGELGRDVIKALYDELGAQASGAAAANMSTLGGYVSNLKDQWQLFLLEIARSGALDSAKDTLKDLLDQITDLRNNGSLTRWAQQISDAMVATGTAVKNFALGVVALKDELVLLTKVLVAIKLGGFISNLVRAGVSMGGLGIKAAAATTSVKALGTAIKALPGRWLITLGLIGGERVLALINELTDRSEELNRAFNNLESEVRLNEARRELQQTATEYQRLADQVRAYSDTALKSRQQIIDLDAIERANYQQKLQAYQAFTRRTLAEVEARVRLGEATEKELARAQSAYEAATDAMTELRETTDLVTEANRNGLGLDTQLLVNRYDELKEAGMEAADAMRQVVENLPIGEPEGLKAIGALIKDLSRDTELTANDISKILNDAFANVTNGELARMATEIDTTLQTGSDQARILANLINDRLGQSFAKLGVDLQEVQTGISSSGQEALSTFRTLTGFLSQAGLEGERSAQAIETAFTSMYANLNGAEKEIAQSILKGAVDEGLVSVERMKQLLGEAGTASQDMAAQIEQGQGRIYQALDQTANKVAETTNRLRESGEVARSLGELVAGYINAASAEIATLGEAAQRSFAQSLDLPVEPVLNDVEQLRQGIESAQMSLRDNINSMLTSFDASGISSFAAEVEAAKNRTLIAFNQQKLAYQDLMNSIEDGSLQGNALVQQAEAAIDRFDLLDQQDLSTLRSAISSARSELDTFNQSAENTLTNLQNELDRMRGNLEDVEKRRFEQQKAELQAQIEQAKALNDQDALRDLQQSLDLLEEIHRERNRQIQQERQEQAEREKPDPQPPTPPPSSTPSAGQVVDLRLPDGQTATVSGSRADMDALLDYLAQAGARAAE